MRRTAQITQPTGRKARFRCPLATLSVGARLVPSARISQPPACDWPVRSLAQLFPESCCLSIMPVYTVTCRHATALVVMAAFACVVKRSQRETYPPGSAAQTTPPLTSKLGIGHIDFILANEGTSSRLIRVRRKGDRSSYCKH